MSADSALLADLPNHRYRLPSLSRERYSSIQGIMESVCGVTVFVGLVRGGGEEVVDFLW